MAAATGTLVADRYRIVRALGRGGMATVYLAEDENLGRQVAIKRLHADSAEDTERRFAREAKLGASLNHPNLVWVYDTVADDEGVLIVMEYVDGSTLGHAIADGPLRPRRAVEAIAAVASALEHAHEAGIVHRDVKPSNVLLGEEGVVKLADLGIASATDRTRITRSGQALGTASYMAPEQLEGERATPASDIYALATVAFEALTGRKAREGRSPVEVAHAISAKPAPDLREAWQHAPAEAAEVLRRGMARDPAARPESACDLASELARALGEETTARHLLDAARAATGGAAAASPPRADTPENGGSTPAPPPPSPTPAPQRPAPASAPNRYATRSSTLRRGTRLALVAAIAALAVVVAVVVLASGGSEEPSREAGQADSIDQGGTGSGSTGGSDDGATPPETTTPGATSPSPGASGGAAEGARLNRQGFALLNAGKAGEAVPVLQRSVDAFPRGTTDVQYAFALFNLGKALRTSGRPKEAVPVLERRLQIPNQRDTVQKELDAARRAAG